MKAGAIKIILSAVLFTALIGTIAGLSLLNAQEVEKSVESGIMIKRIRICRAIKEREPIGIGDSFPANIKQVFCFTDVRGAGEESFITHNWYHENKFMVAVKLKVAGTHWRTWSSKRIDPSWTGNWRVDIKDPEDRKISSITFSVGDDEKKIEEK